MRFDPFAFSNALRRLKAAHEDPCQHGRQVASFQETPRFPWSSYIQ